LGRYCPEQGRSALVVIEDQPLGAVGAGGHKIQRPAGEAGLNQECLRVVNDL
jgi:hypothetical protein